MGIATQRQDKKEKKFVIEPNISMENLYSKTKSLYKLVILASKRALELNSGAPRLVESRTNKVALIALEEIADGKVTLKAAPEKVLA